MDPDPGCPKTCGSGFGSGSVTLLSSYFCFFNVSKRLGDLHLVLTNVLNCRRIEDHTMRCAVTVGDARPSDVVTKIRQIILRSDHPEAVHYMRGIGAIRQALAR